MLIDYASSSSFSSKHAGRGRMIPAMCFKNEAMGRLFVRASAGLFSDAILVTTVFSMW